MTHTLMSLKPWARSHRAATEPVTQAGCPEHNVQITSRPATAPVRDRPAPQGEAGWSIRDGSGRSLASGMPDRSTALAWLGVLALQGAVLPLHVHAPDGSPTGDHLAG